MSRERDQRPPLPRKRTWGLRELRRQRRGLPVVNPGRPQTRGECVAGARPCPWVTCRYHLAFDVTPRGGLTANFPGLELHELPETCALDVADRGGAPAPEVAAAMNLTRCAVQLIVRAGKVRLELEGEG